MPLFLDLPQTAIEHFEFMIAGWVAGPTDNIPIEIRVDGRKCKWHFYERPDLQPLLSSHEFVSGVYAIGKVNDCSGASEIRIDFSFGSEIITRKVGITPGLHDQLAAEAQLREETRTWCMERLRCPSCSAVQLEFSPDRVTCRKCATVFLQDSRALNFISPDLRASSNIVETEQVSSNPYTPAALELIEQTVRTGGVVLDCGAGSRPRRMKNVVNVEIVDYMSTDVLAIGEALPFQDGVFDATISLAVLEHVRDPFKCADELIRVTKPNGLILVDVPFLQPEHGYPHHYYNMTQQGLGRLFDGKAKILDLSVPLHGHPIWTLQWFMSTYLGGLPPHLREKFAAKTAGELAVPIQISDFTKPEIISLNQEAVKTLACLNSLIVQKL